jgi:hypothetical protein
MYFFLIAYSILGAGIKYIDDAFDKKTFNKVLAITITPLLSILGVYSMIIDPASATILLAIISGVLLKFKIDNIAFILGFIITIAISYFIGVQFLLIPLILLTAAALLDEVGNDYIDKVKNQLNMKNPLHMFAKYFFGHRWIMKTAILFLVFVNVVPMIFFVAMIMFDYSYLTVNAYSAIKSEKPNSTNISKVISTVGYIFK